MRNPQNCPLSPRQNVPPSIANHLAVSHRARQPEEDRAKSSCAPPPPVGTCNTKCRHSENASARHHITSSINTQLSTAQLNSTRQRRWKTTPLRFPPSFSHLGVAPRQRFTQSAHGQFRTWDQHHYKLASCRSSIVWMSRRRRRRHRPLPTASSGKWDQKTLN